jgi:hypothetical protein
MATDPASANAARTAAEEILQVIYGDDLSGCSVRLDSIVEIISSAIGNASGTQAEMLALYEKAVEALHLLSTPPATGENLEPDALLALLSGRLDTIRELTKKLISTAATVGIHDSVARPAP